MMADGDGHTYNAGKNYDVKPDDDDDDDVDDNDESPISNTLNLSHFVFDGIE